MKSRANFARRGARKGSLIQAGGEGLRWELDATEDNKMSSPVTTRNVGGKVEKEDNFK